MVFALAVMFGGRSSSDGPVRRRKMKKSFVLLVLLLAAVLFVSCSEVLAGEIELESVKIINHGMINYEYIRASHSKTPANASGTFEYQWTSSDPNVAFIEAGTANGPEVRVYPGFIDGQATITLTVTQTLSDGTKIVRTDSITDHSSNYYDDSWSSVGCNTAAGTWYALIMSVAFLLFFRTKSRYERNKS